METAIQQLTEQRPTETYYIYLIQNRNDLKLYVGQTIAPSKRWSDHKCCAKRSIKRKEAAKLVVDRALAKHGIDNYTFQVIETHETKQDVNEAERFWIQYFNTRNPNIGYNIAEGGVIVGLTEANETSFKSGSKHVNAKLTDDDIVRIMELYNTTDLSQTALAEQFNVTRSAILNIVSGTTWSHITKIGSGVLKQNRTSKRAKGSNNGVAKLNEKQVSEIVDLYETGNYSQHELADKYMTSRGAVNSILSGTTWAHLTNINDDNKPQPNIGKRPKNQYSKLTETDIPEILRLYIDEQWSQTKIGDKFGVNGTAIGSLLRGNTWSHITKIGVEYDSIPTVEHTKRNQLNIPHYEGERHGRAKFTNEDVLEIVRLYNTGEHSQKAIAVRFGVDRSTVGAILSGECWSHITKIDYDTYKAAPKTPNNTKLTPQAILDIISLRNAGSSINELVDEFGVGTCTVWDIINGKRHSKITGITPPPNKPKP